MTLDEIRIYFVGIKAIPIFLEDGPIAGQPLLIELNVPIPLNVFVIQECHNACVVLASGVNVIALVGLSLITFIVDIINGGVSASKLLVQFISFKETAVSRIVE